VEYAGVDDAGVKDAGVEFARIDTSRLMPMMQELMIVVDYAWGKG
jgi:hypothetical protein